MWSLQETRGDSIHPAPWSVPSPQSGTTIIIYNGLDRLTQVATPVSTVDYAYDALGRRITRTEGTDTVNYHLSGKTDLTDYRTDTGGTLTVSTLRGADGLISGTDHTTPTPETDYYLFSPHGDTSAIADEGGNVTQTYRYDSFGNPLSAGSPAYGNTGKWQRDLDSTTGTIHMGAREYDPALGRFNSADPLKGSTLDPQQRNRYPYAGNNPLTRYDLNGLYPGEGYVDTAIMFGEWLTGTGPESREFGPDSQQVQDLRNAPGVQAAINRFYAQNTSRDCGDYSPLESPYWAEFGLSGAINAGSNPTRQFVGGYTVEITPNQDQTMTITISNRSSMSSFLYHAYPECWDYGRLHIGPLEIAFPGSNTYQTYTWTEPLQCDACSV